MDSGQSVRSLSYRAESFGQLIAYCALAVGIWAIRHRDRKAAAVTGALFGIASASHAIPAVVVALYLTVFIGAELLASRDWRTRRATVVDGLAVAIATAIVGLAIRFTAGGTFGLQGASNQATYAKLAPYDMTAYLSNLVHVPISTGHFYYSPGTIIRILFEHASGWGWSNIEVIVATLAVTAISVVAWRTTGGTLRTACAVSVAFLAALVVLTLAFDEHYHLFTQATFGIRRLATYLSTGVMVFLVAICEIAVRRIENRHVETSVLVAGVVSIAVAGAVLPSDAATATYYHVQSERRAAVDWLREHTACNARILSNYRTEDAFDGLTGRFALVEGMGPFLRPGPLHRVDSLVAETQAFFADPQAHRAFLLRNHIDYVVLDTDPALEIGPLPIPADAEAMAAADFLTPAFSEPGLAIFRVEGATPLPTSPLLRLRYLHCDTTALQF